MKKTLYLTLVLMLLVLAARSIGCAWLKDNAYPLVEPACKLVCQVLGDNGCNDMAGSAVPGGELLKPFCEKACEMIPDTIDEGWRECVVESPNCETSDACFSDYGITALGLEVDTDE